MPPLITGPGDLDLSPIDLESGIRVRCDVGYLCANFGLPWPFRSRVRPDVCDRQTSDVRQKHRLMPPPYGGGGITTFDLTVATGKLYNLQQNS